MKSKEDIEKHQKLRPFQTHNVGYVAKMLDDLEHIKSFLVFELINHYDKCKYYSYDSDAIESYCSNKKAWKHFRVKIGGLTAGDFLPQRDCPKCEYYELETKEK